MSRIPGWTNVSSLVLRFVLFAGVALCAQLAAPAWAAVIYVRGDAAGAKDGHSWADAYTDLPAALAAAVSGDEIWVAQGTYKPTTGTLRSVSFALRAGVGLYGGFAGTETQRGQRNWEANATILSGDIGTTSSAVDNSYHVVIGADLAVLDGFTITRGNANALGSLNSGGGMHNYNSSPTVTNCTLTSNTASGDGGGMNNVYSSPTVTDCTFSGNSANRGGGMNNVHSSPTVTNCTFSGSMAGTFGGGLFSDNGSPTVTDCTFSGNTAGIFGGGMFNWNGSPILTNCMFSGNTADNGGGGMYNGRSPYNSSGSSPVVTNCTFSGNAAYWGGGGMANSYCSPTVTNCAFSDNAAHSSGGMSNENCSPTVTNCAFTSNTANGTSGAGGGMGNYNSSPTVTNCTFSGNTASDYGGGMYNYSSSPTSDSSPTVTNCIFWDNSAPLAAEICRDDTGTPTFRHCDIRGSGGSGASWDPALGVDGGGNIAADPRFVAPATPAGPDGLWQTRDDGLRLRSDSPCIRAADPAVAPETDILGLRRKTAPDIGAYEYYPIVPASADPAWLLFK